MGAKRFGGDRELWIALTDDWELRGNGQGSVRDLQHHPALRLMDLYESLGLRSTFNVEVAQQLAFERHVAAFPALAADRDLWRRTVPDMKDRGFDVQLHLHPQWHRATFDGRSWSLDRRWNLASYPSEVIERLLRDAITYLHDLLGESHRIVSFRGGSWGVVAPGARLLESLERHGIRIDISIVKGIHYDGEAIQLDYTELESPHFPYHPDYDDPRRVAAVARGIVEIPTQTFPIAPARSSGRWMAGARRLASRLRSRLIGRSAAPAPAVEERRDDPFGFLSGRGYEAEVICSLSAALDGSELEAGFRHVLDRALKRPGSAPVPLVLENHTKDLQSDASFRRIARLIGSVRRRYGRVARFVTLTEIVDQIERIDPLLRAGDGEGWERCISV